jgi:O-antigen/teichoic acid export membrane protein
VQLIVLVACAELVAMRVVETSGQAFQAYERLRATAVVGAVPFLLRSIAAVAFLAAGGHAPESWAWMYLAATTVAAGGCVAYTVGVLGRPRPNVRVLVSTLRLGVMFSVAQSASSIYGDIDKAMLARLASLDATGIFAAGYRVVSTSFMPVMALLQASYARFFARGRGGVGSTLAFAKSLVPASVGYSLAAGVALFAAAPLAPVVLGSDFGEATTVIRWLAVVPLLQALLYLPADALTGAGFQSARAALQVGGAALNVALNAILIPAHGWRGAAWATIVTLAALAVALWALAVVLRRSSDVRGRTDDVPSPLVSA